MVIVSNLQGFQTARQVFNLFGYFGELRKILFMKNKHNAMMEFASQAAAEKAIVALNKK